MEISLLVLSRELMGMGVAGIIIRDYGLAPVKRYWESQFVRYGHMVKHVDHPLDSGMSWVSPGSRKLTGSC